MNTQEWFKLQIEGVDWFYIIEADDCLHIKRHRGGLDTFPTNLKFTQMMNGIPQFVLDQPDE